MEIFIRCLNLVIVIKELCKVYEAKNNYSAHPVTVQLALKNIQDKAKIDHLYMEMINF